MSRYIVEGVFTDQLGNAVLSGTVSVYLAGTTTAASIYTTLTGATAVNSVTASSTTGAFTFYWDDFDYSSDQIFDIVLSKTGYTSQTYYGQRGNVVPGNYTISAAKTVTNFHRVPKGVIYVHATGGSIAFSGGFDAGPYKIFNSFDAGDITFSGIPPIVYPEWWGAVPDGATDCSSALQCAVGSLLGTYGGEIYLHPGLYALSTAVSILPANENLLFHGAGPQSSWLYMLGATGNALELTGTALSYVSGCTLQDFGISRNTASPTSGCGISCTYTSFLSIRNIAIYHQTFGVNLNGVANSYVDRCWITRTAGTDAAVGVRIDGSIANPSVYISKVLVNFDGQGGTNYGFLVTGDDTRDVRFDYVEANNTDYGIAVICTSGSPEDYSLDLHITNPILDRISTRGIFLSGVYNAYVDGGWILMDDTNASNYCIFLDASHYNTFSNTQLYGDINTGYVTGFITLNSCTYNIVSTNEFFGCENGVIFQASGNSNIVTGNQFASTTAPVADAGTGNLIHHNKGFVSENSGLSAAIASGATIAHGLGGTPAFISVTAAETGPTNLYASVDATNITVTFGGGGSKTFYWQARLASSK